MLTEFLCISHPGSNKMQIAGVIFSNKEILDPLDLDNERIYFTEEERELISSKPEDQQWNFARELAESKKS